MLLTIINTITWPKAPSKEFATLRNVPELLTKLTKCDRNYFEIQLKMIETIKWYNWSKWRKLIGSPQCLDLWPEQFTSFLFTDVSIYFNVEFLLLSNCFRTNLNYKMLHKDVVFVEFTNFVCCCSDVASQRRFWNWLSHYDDVSQQWKP